MRESAGGVFVVNRFGFDNLQRLDPQADFVTTYEASVGAGSNPHDIVALDAERGLVTRYEPPFNDAAIVSLDDGEVLRSVDLSSFATNTSGTPRADRILLRDGVAWVTLQNVDATFTRFEEGRLVAIDAGSEAVLGVVDLGGDNPFDVEALPEGDELLVALAGIFPGLLPQQLTGGVVAVDPISLSVTRMVLDDDDAGGNLTELAIAGEDLAYVVVSDASFTNRVLAFDPRDGTIRRTLLASATFIPDLAVGGGLLAIPDRSALSPGLCLYRLPTAADGNEMLLGCAPLSLSPFSVEALDR